MKKETLKTIRIKIRNDSTERELFSKLSNVLLSSDLEHEFMEVFGRKESIMVG